MSVLWSIILSTVLTGILAVDRTALGQLQISRPIVAAPLLGLILGCPAEGVIAGLIYELLFVRSLPVGSFIPEKPLYPSLMAVLLYAINRDISPGTYVLSAAVVVAIPTFTVDRLADVLWRRSNERTFHRAEVFVRLGRADLARLGHILSILRAGLYHSAAFLLLVAVLEPLFRLTLGGLVSSPGLLTVAAMVPFITGLAGLAAERTQNARWTGFAAGLLLGCAVGIWRHLL
ncbi:MAG: PTS sugar transporter subunit IIC [bacterium]|nr:MAG: PTS sugar transporter subunit IIC [bacterium]